MTPPETEPTAPSPRSAATLVLGHRGASAAERENTMAAFDLAMQLGSDGVELDVRRTGDGQLAVHHDAHLADGRAIVEMTANELAETAVGVPLLGEVLDACRGTLVNIEIKSNPDDPDFDNGYPIARLVVDLIASRRDQHDDLLVTSFDSAAIAAVRAADTSVRTGQLSADVTAPLDAISAAVAGGHGAVMPRFNMVDHAFMDRAGEANLFVGTWTVNDPDEMRRLISLGVDAIISDVPDIGLRVVQAATHRDDV